MENRRELHTLVDELPDAELPAAKRFLEYLRQQVEDPLRVFLNAAPIDDEPVTDEDLAAIREALAERARGEVVSHEEVKRILREAG
jgi:predicted transcriptional regulator